MSDSIKQAMLNLATALPERSKALNMKTKREVSLTFLAPGEWHVAAGGHYAVALGEWGGDFDGEGKTPEDAINMCMASIKGARS